MQDFSAAFGEAFALLVAFDADLVEIVGLSLRVTLTSVLIACLIGFPLGAALAVFKFPGRGIAVIVANALMGLPPVVVGLMVYMMLSNSGPLGGFQLLYTPSAMVIAQSILVTPIIIALTRQVIADLHVEYDELLHSMNATHTGMVTTLLWDARFSLMTAALAGLGRALAEVGAVIMVGGNINHVTRVMTTTITLETARGELALALGLGMILLALSLIVNGALSGLRAGAERTSYA